MVSKALLFSFQNHHNTSTHAMFALTGERLTKGVLNTTFQLDDTKCGKKNPLKPTVTKASLIRGGDARGDRDD